MLNVLSTAVPVVAARVLTEYVPRPKPLEYMLERVKLNLVPFNAQDIYQVCVVAYNSDTIGLLQDADFMRGISDAFQRSDQTVLSPFQASLISDTLRKAGIFVSPKEVMVPEEDAVSAESLIATLRAMNVTRTRDERKIAEVQKLMFPIIDEFSPTQLSLAIAELAKLSCSNTDFLGKLANRVINVQEDLGALDISLTAKSLALSKGVPWHVLRRFFDLVEARMSEFQPEDFLNVLEGLRALGPQFINTFTKMVLLGLDLVESMDAVTLTHYLVCFTVLEYRQREHIEIYADALVDVAVDLSERDLLQALIALDRLQLLNETMFATMATCLMQYAKLMNPRNIAPVMDICSRVPHKTDALMGCLLDRAMECTRIFPPYQLAEILEIVSLYPPAREHPLVPLFGKQAKFRLEIMGPEAVAMATRGLAQLGYVDPEFYALAAETSFRFGFKDWSLLEPILMGLCLSQNVPMHTVKIVASHIAPMARSMSLQEVVRANRYLTQLGCEEDFVYRSMATRVLQFVKEVTPDMPVDLHQLLQRGAVHHPAGETGV